MHLREKWGSRLGFLMATAGSAIGLGSLWKFPYATGTQGGGLFVLSYLVFTFVIGLPLFMGELIMGRKAQRCVVESFHKLSTKSYWSMLGWLSVIISLLVLSFYNVVAGWGLNYSLMSLMNLWKGKSQAEISAIFSVVQSSADISLWWSTLFLIACAAILYKGIRKGIELWSKILTPLLLLILLALFVYGLTLPGATEAFSFIFYPQSQLFSLSSLLEALGLACFTLSVGMGVLITYGSYMKQEDSIATTATTIGLMDIVVSLIASFIIFSITFTFQFHPSEGAGLLFTTLPTLFSKIPGGMLWSTLFFLLVVFAALTSAIALLEVAVSSLMERCRFSRKKALLACCVVIFIVGLPSVFSHTTLLFSSWKLIYGVSFFDTINKLCFSWLLPINALGTALFIGHCIHTSVLRQEFGSHRFLFYLWHHTLKWIVPLAIVFLMLYEAGLFA